MLVFSNKRKTLCFTQRKVTEDVVYATGELSVTYSLTRGGYTVSVGDQKEIAVVVPYLLDGSATLHCLAWDFAKYHPASDYPIEHAKTFPSLGKDPTLQNAVWDCIFGEHSSLAVSTVISVRTFKGGIVDTKALYRLCEFTFMGSKRALFVVPVTLPIETMVNSTLYRTGGRVELRRRN